MSQQPTQKSDSTPAQSGSKQRLGALLAEWRSKDVGSASERQ